MINVLDQTSRLVFISIFVHVQILIDLECDCFQNGTRRCLKNPNNHCLCKDGYQGTKCEKLSQAIINSREKQFRLNWNGYSVPNPVARNRENSIRKSVVLDRNDQ